MRKMSLRLALVCALICIITATVVFAMSASWNIQEFINRRYGTFMPSSALSLVQTEPDQKGGELELATFSLREAIFDGHGVYLIVAVQPLKSNYLLLGIDAAPEDPISNLGPLFSNIDGSIATYARNNQQKLLHTSVHDNLVRNWSGDYILEEDGTLVYMLHSAYESDEKEITLELSCAAMPYITNQGNEVPDLSQRKETLLRVTVQNTGTLWRVINAEPQIYTDCGVRVDQLTLSGTPMAIYARIEFSVFDKEKYATTDDGLWFEFIDADGEPLPTGVASIGSIIATNDDGTRFVQTWSLQADETPPNEIILKGYNRWECQGYQAHVFEMNR